MMPFRRARKVDRIASAPEGYRSTQSRADLTRHAELLATLPAPGEVRVITTPGRAAGAWNLDLAARDRIGLLASFTGVLVRQVMHIDQAVLATWEDGAALQALIVRCDRAPDADALRTALEWSLDRPLWAPPVQNASVSFDQSASEVYTACEVTAPDQPGLLHAVAVAIANSGVDIHAASATTRDDRAVDRFDLSDRNHGRLPDAVAATIAENLSGGTNTEGFSSARVGFAG